MVPSWASCLEVEANGACGILGMAGCREAVRRQPPKTYRFPPCQSPALKIQGKLNTRPGKVGVWRGASQCQEAGAWGQGLRNSPVPSPDDPLLRGWLPRQQQGGLGRHGRYLQLGPCDLCEGGSRLVSVEGRGCGESLLVNPGNVRAVRCVQANREEILSATQGPCLWAHQSLAADPGSLLIAGCCMKSQSSRAESWSCLKEMRNSESRDRHGAPKALAP